MPLKNKPFDLDDDSSVLIGSRFKGTSGKRPVAARPAPRSVPVVRPKVRPKIARPVLKAGI